MGDGHAPVHEATYTAYVSEMSRATVNRGPFPPLVNSVLHTIGRTPVVRLERLSPPDGATVVIKLEYFNPTGSYKDRMALAMIDGAEARGVLQPGMRDNTSIRTGDTPS